MICQSSFASLRLSFHALVAQRLEQRTHNPLVVGSNPTEGILLCEGRETRDRRQETEVKKAPRIARVAPF